MFSYALYRVTQFFVNLFPIGWCYRAAAVLADIKFRLAWDDRAAVIDNLTVITGDRRRAELLAPEVFRHFGRYLVEFFRMTHDVDDRFIRDKVAIKNFDYLKDALAFGRGVIILTAHVGNWELGGLVISSLGYPFTAIALPHKDRQVNELFNQQREKFGVTIVPVHLAFRRCLKDLKANGAVAVLGDRDFTATGEVGELFGKKTMIPKGAALFAYRTGAAILPSFLWRREGGRFVLEFQSPLVLPDPKAGISEEEYTRMVVAEQARVIEEAVRRDPAQWLLFRRFWFDEATGPERVTST